MAMTIVVKDELSRVELARPCCRKAEVSALLRFAGHLWLSAGRIVLEAELDTAAAARRLEAGISAMFGHPAEVVMVEPPGGRKGNSYLVRVTRGRAGESLARQAGLIDSGRCPVRGLPRQVVSGAACDCAAAWRGAFLARGSAAPRRRGSPPPPPPAHRGSPRRAPPGDRLRTPCASRRRKRWTRRRGGRGTTPASP